MSIFSHRLRTRDSYLNLPWKEWDFFKKHYYLLEQQSILANIENFFRTMPNLYSLRISKLNKKQFKNSANYRKSKRDNIVLVNDDVVLNLYNKNGFMIKNDQYALCFNYFNTIGK